MAALARGNVDASTSLRQPPACPGAKGARHVARHGEPARADLRIRPAVVVPTSTDFISADKWVVGPAVIIAQQATLRVPRRDPMAGARDSLRRFSSPTRRGLA